MLNNQLISGLVLQKETESVHPHNRNKNDTHWEIICNGKAKIGKMEEKDKSYKMIKRIYNA